jgi:hypothetical protein
MNSDRSLFEEDEDHSTHIDDDKSIEMLSFIKGSSNKKLNKTNYFESDA